MGKKEGSEMMTAVIAGLGKIASRLWAWLLVTYHPSIHCCLRISVSRQHSSPSILIVRKLNANSEP